MPLPRSKSLIAALLLAGLAVVAVLIALREHRARVEAGERLSRLDRESRTLRQQNGQLTKDLAAARAGLPAPPRSEAPQAPQPDEAARLEENRFVIQLREKLNTAVRTADQMHGRVLELESAVEKLGEENKRLAASEAELKDKLAGTGRVLDAVQNELKAKSDRMVQVETSNRLLRDENRTLNDKSARLPGLLRDLEDINRRRETYLNSLLRRYRDVTDQYRSMAVRMESPRGESAAPEPADLSRIQNTISLAEEDLRQLTNLNAQASRVQSRIAGK